MSSDDSIPLPGDVDTLRRSISKDGECSAIVPEGPTTSIVEKLMANTVAARGLWQVQWYTQENAQQSAIIKELEDKLQQGKSQQTDKALGSPQEVAEVE
jgi:hypothetical protein